MPVTHKFVSAKTDAADTTLVRKSNWNDTHNIDMAVTAVSTTYAVLDTDELLLCTCGATGFTVTLPTAVGRTGRLYKIKKVDSAAGAATVATTASQTIDGATSYILGTQWQYIAVVSDGSNWQIVANN